MAAKQMRIVGTERKDINEDIENKAATYVEARDAHREMTSKLKDAKEALTLAMKTAKLQEYVCDKIDQRVIFEKETVTNVKVKKIELPGEEDAEEAGEAD